MLTSVRGQEILVELKNGETVVGKLNDCDLWMNLTLSDVVFNFNKGEDFNKMEEIYIRGNHIKFLRMPDQVCQSAFFLIILHCFRETNTNNRLWTTQKNKIYLTWSREIEIRGREEDFKTTDVSTTTGIIMVGTSEVEVEEEVSEVINFNSFHKFFFLYRRMAPHA